MWVWGSKMVFAVFISWSISTRSAGPKGPSDLCKDRDLSLEIWILVLRLGFGPWGLNLGVEIMTSRLEPCGFWPGGWNLNPRVGIWTQILGFGPKVWDLDPEVEIWTWWLGYGPQGWNLGHEAEHWDSRLYLWSKGWIMRLGFWHQS